MSLDLHYDWDWIRAATDGRSYVDVPKLNISSKAEAKKFLLAYGYDIDDPLVREEIWRIYFEAVAFLRNILLDPDEQMPTEFLQKGAASDILRMLTEVSKPQPDQSSKWCCAILRVMHILSHLYNDVRIENFKYAREQIFGRFDQLVSQVDNERRWIFGTKDKNVKLVRYLKKQRKDRNSIVIKLLSKPGALVEAIYDSLGFRFITESKSEAFQLIELLRDMGVVSPPNIHPQRSFNTLLPTDVFQETIEDLQHKLRNNLINEVQARHELARVENESGVSLSAHRNRFTSSYYRAIQFTCRQLVVAPDPAWQFWQKIKEEFEKDPVGVELLKKIPVTLRQQRTFYYPFEIQIMDKDSYVEAIGGRSRHRDYKARQRLMARNRVLRDLI